MKNYIAEINQFYNFLDTHKLSTGQISLWHGLMHICNKTRWQQTFSVANKTLEAITGLSRTAILKCREALKELGLINFICNGNRATVYHLNVIPSATEVETLVKYEDSTKILTNESEADSDSDYVQLELTFEENDVEESVQVESETVCMSESVQVSKSCMSNSDTLNKQYNTIYNTRTKNVNNNSSFTPPTLEDVQTYCTSKNYTHIVVTIWHSYYRATGWYISGNTKMVDWKASVDCWEAREADKESKRPNYSNKPNNYQNGQYQNKQYSNAGRQSSVKPKNKFHNFEQRKTDYNQLLAEYNGYNLAEDDYATAI